jgi:hypothetical protein
MLAVMAFVAVLMTVTVALVSSVAYRVCPSGLSASPLGLAPAASAIVAVTVLVPVSMTLTELLRTLPT